jgi:GTP-binding protein HflX
MLVTTKSRERAILVGLGLQRPKRENGVDSASGVGGTLDELAQLVDTAGGEAVARIVQTRHTIDPAFFIGKGKAEELAWLAQEKEVQLVVFDDDLSPVQLRNLERVIQRKILDRSGIILDIFASRARTSEAKSQVELAQLQYMLPRLTRQWTHLSKQYGGIGTKGPGETQIETDRRVIRSKISHLRAKLRHIAKERAVQRKGRALFPRVALVGYTNVGKSTLLNRLAGAGVLVEDRLFATLDSTVRLVALSPVHKILISDTVGFIRKLPHHLVASFKNTLDEVVESDILLHVIDAAHPLFEEQIDVVNETLEEIGAGKKPTLMVFNKIDAVKGREGLKVVAAKYSDAVFLSAARGINTRELGDRLIALLDHLIVEETLTLDHTDQKILSDIHDSGEILEQHYDDASVTIRFRMNRANAERLKKLLAQNGRTAR